MVYSSEYIELNDQIVVNNLLGGYCNEVVVAYFEVLIHRLLYLVTER
jgi:hypothetical protein